MINQIDPNYIENTVYIDSLNIDPFDVVDQDSVWITGGYALKRYVAGAWIDGDIDYTVRDEEARARVVKYFDQFNHNEKRIGKLGTVFYKIGDFIVNILGDMYDDPRKRFFQHDLSVCQIAHDGTQYIMSKICYEHTKRMIFSRANRTWFKGGENPLLDRLHKYESRGFLYSKKEDTYHE